MEENEIKSISCNNALTPFLRNQYFYGKLLTVRDFENEQNYFIKKQRLINKHIHGEGVVCGLTVEKVKENQIKIKSGIALDCCGREIIVPDDVIINLSGKGNGEYWVIISYSECGKEQVAAAINANSCEENCCFSRIEEGYKIEILDKKPEICSSFQADNLCKSWKSLEFGKEEGSGLHFNPHPHHNPQPLPLPLDPGFSANTDMISQNSPEEFIKKYQGSCSQSESKPLVLAKIGLRVKKIIIDNALITATGFDKKLVHTNPKLFEILKCLGSKEENDLVSITEINWEHDKTYRVNVVSNGTIESAGDNSVVISGDAPDQDTIKPGMYLYAFGKSFQRGIITQYSATDKTIYVNENWSLRPIRDNYYVMNDESNSYFQRMENHEITFGESMETSSINAKTFAYSVGGYVRNDKDDIEIDLPGMPLPVEKEWKDNDTKLAFGVPENFVELVEKIFEKGISQSSVLVSKKKTMMSTSLSSTGMAESPDWQDVYIGLRSKIEIKGDFVYTKDGAVLDANYIKEDFPQETERPGVCSKAGMVSNMNF